MHKVMAFSIDIITSPTEDVDLRPALKEFPELKGDYIKIPRPPGDVDLLIGINDAHLHPYLTNPGKHCKGKLCLLTSKFGTGYLLDGSHPEIKVKPYYFSPDAMEKSRGTRRGFKKSRGFKRRPKVSHRTSRVAIFDRLECEELEAAKCKGRPTGAMTVTTTQPAVRRGWAVGVLGCHHHGALHHHQQQSASWESRAQGNC